MSKNEIIKKLPQRDDISNLKESAIEEYNKNIEKAMNEIDKGEYTSPEEAVKCLLKNHSC
ncbi:hypothetical protein [Ferruginibacter sp.]